MGEEDNFSSCVLTGVVQLGTLGEQRGGHQAGEGKGMDHRKSTAYNGFIISKQSEESSYS